MQQTQDGSKPASLNGLVPPPAVLIFLVFSQLKYVLIALIVAALRQHQHREIKLFLKHRQEMFRWTWYHSMYLLMRLVMLMSLSNLQTIKKNI
ncbi:MAG: hypothetical protein BGO09_04835 [Bacteroidetes bacterium 47-18]|nr:MAG: hypothetical protein BGO09_04835 [Bacteroidetes bacterium 47-18]